MKNFCLMFGFEDMNPDYIEYQFDGLIMELSKKHGHIDEGYISEKLRNIKNHFNYTFDNFTLRIKEGKGIREKYLEYLKKKENEEAIQSKA